MNVPGSFSLGLTGFISLQSKGTTQESLPAPQFKSISSSTLSPLCGTILTSAHDYWKSHSSYYNRHLLAKWWLVFNMPSMFDMTFLPRSKHLFISLSHSPSVVILEPKKRKSVTVSTFFPFVFHEAMELDAMILVFRMLNFKPAFSLSSFTLIDRLFSSSSLSAIRVVSSNVIVDISPRFLDSSLWFFQPGISYDVLCT